MLEEKGIDLERRRRADSQRLAMRTGGSANANLTWLFGDHLGSTSVTANYAGTLISRTLYKPLHSIQGRLWGEVRYQSGALPTKYTFTGQYSHTADFGLMYYVARWYDPVLGRFAQADSLVPGAGNPGAWDRFAYTSNNPLNMIDPTGHFEECPGYDYGCGEESSTSNPSTTGNSKPYAKEDKTGTPPDWWNIFSYDTLNVHGVLEAKLIAGVEILPRMSVNMEALRNFDINNFDFSIGVDVSITLGLSGSADVMMYAQGSDGSVLDQSNYLIVADGISANMDVCDTVCLGGEATLDPLAENGYTSNVGYGIGAGYGIDYGVDLIRAGMDIFYATQSGFQLFP